MVVMKLLVAGTTPLIAMTTMLVLKIAVIQNLENVLT